MSNHITPLDRLQFINTTQHFIDVKSDNSLTENDGKFTQWVTSIFWRSEVFQTDIA